MQEVRPYEANITERCACADAERIALAQHPGSKHHCMVRSLAATSATEAEADEYFESVKKIVEAQKDVYGELPDFDFGE